jgi:hypothetical protein
MTGLKGVVLVVFAVALELAFIWQLALPSPLEDRPARRGAGAVVERGAPSLPAMTPASSVIEVIPPAAPALTPAPRPARRARALRGGPCQTGTRC